MTIPTAQEALKQVESLQHARNEVNLQMVGKAIEQALREGLRGTSVPRLEDAVKQHLENLGYTVNINQSSDPRDQGSPAEILITWHNPKPPRDRAPTESELTEAYYKK